MSKPWWVSAAQRLEKSGLKVFEFVAIQLIMCIVKHEKYCCKLRLVVVT